MEKIKCYTKAMKFLIYFGKNYDTIMKSMPFWLNKEKYGTIPKNMEYWLTLKKKHYGNIPKIIVLQ